MMKNLFIALALTCCTAVQAQDYIESSTFNKDFRGAKRTLQYQPDGRGFVCVNGNNLYTRALYGGHSLFRLETSDRPIFGAYHKKENRNIHFIVRLPQSEVRLDATDYCLARYEGGMRSYLLKHKSWGKGSIKLTLVAYQGEREGGCWKIETNHLPKGCRISAVCCPTVPIKLNRSGDMGADPANCFAPAEGASQMQTITFVAQKCSYVSYEARRLTIDNQRALATEFAQADAERLALTNRLIIDTPDPYLNTLGGTLAAAADGIWDGEVWLHGAIGWRMPLSGWRAAYTGDCLGWHDRARTHFNAYAASQVKEVEPTLPHPTQDTLMNWARAEKRWGTQMYSNGYICRNPNRNNQMHHYDMNLCYMDELLWHLNWTGDVAYAQQIWPVIEAHLAWEKRNYDPDGNGLYDAYCCIWASDALYYNSGGVTHSSAYNYRANRMAALIAGKMGKDPTPYIHEADKILHAINTELWMKEKGVWAEFKDFMGEKRLHTHPAVWTIYHALDSDIADAFQAYSATAYVDRAIPHIPVRAEGLKNEGYATISTTDWHPYAWSINNVAFAEVMHTALAYWQAGRANEATHLLKSSILDGMYIGNSPGNIGQISFYDAARGESYRDFGDPIGVLSRCLIQGLFGLQPDALNNRLVVRPGLPADWNHASLHQSDIDFDFVRKGLTEVYTLTQRLPNVGNICFRLRALSDKIRQITLNGKPVQWQLIQPSVGYPAIEVNATVNGKAVLRIEWAGGPLAQTLELDYEHPFTERNQGEMKWFQFHPEALRTHEVQPVEAGLDLHTEAGNTYKTVPMDSVFNANVTDIFNNRYLTPRSPYTTLQIPVQGIGEWCHPKESFAPDDSGVRAASKQGVFTTPMGIPFRTPQVGKNIAFCSLFNNYPDSLSLPLHGKARGIELLLAGSTNHMQCYMENACITVTYTDETTEKLSLIPPYNWCPIEQDYFADGLAFRLPALRPYRVALKSGVVSRDLGKELNITGVYGRQIPGGGATLLCLPLNASKELKSLSLRVHSNDVVIGLMAATLYQ